MSMSADSPPEGPPPAAADWRDKAGLAIRAALLIAVLVFVAMAVQGGRRPLEVGTPAPELHLRSYDGKVWGLERFAGKPMVVNFWGTWCPPCMRELPHFAASSKAHADEVVFVGATVQSEPPGVFATIKRFDITYPIAEVDGHSSARWKAQTLPSTYLLDKDHNVVWSVAGGLSRSDLEGALEQHLGIKRAD
jgi:thiol-disulfide isomerase/thioredoxin